MFRKSKELGGSVEACGSFLKDVDSVLLIDASTIMMAGITKIKTVRNAMHKVTASSLFIE